MSDVTYEWIVSKMEENTFHAFEIKLNGKLYIYSGWWMLEIVYGDNDEIIDFDNKMDVLEYDGFDGTTLEKAVGRIEDIYIQV